MTVNEFIEKLQRLKPSLRESEVFTLCSNGLLVTPEIKIIFNSDTNEYCDQTLITWK